MKIENKKDWDAICKMLEALSSAVISNKSNADLVAAHLHMATFEIGYLLSNPPEKKSVDREEASKTLAVDATARNSSAV